MKKIIKQYDYYESPIGLIEIIVNQDQVIALTFVKTKTHCESHNNYLIMKTKQQLDSYFNKKISHLNLPFAINGTYFQERVWSKIYQIPYGANVTYQQLAQMIAKPRAIVAVANAVAKNKLAIIIPSHRIISQKQKVNYLSYKHQKFLQELEKTN